MSEANTPSAPSAASNTPASIGDVAETNESQNQPGAQASESGNDAADTEREKRSGNSAAYWRRQAERQQRQNDQLLQKILGTPDSAPKARPAATEMQTGAPRQEDFASYEAYLEARADWRVEQKLAEARKSEQNSKKQELREESRKTFEANMKKAEERIPDIREVVDEMFSDPQFPISEAMADAILESDKSADLAYWLAKNPAEAARISRLSQVSAARELGRIEGSLSTPAKRIATQAPPPPNTLRGGDTPSKNPADMSMAEYAKWRSAGGGTRAA